VYRLLRTVVVEEMLHLALAANVLVAVGDGKRAGPPFEFYRFERERRASDELCELCETVTDRHPELDGLGETLANVGETR
jgi:hypothetical protein